MKTVLKQKRTNFFRIDSYWINKIWCVLLCVKELLNSIMHKNIGFVT